jgi:hypothetical protein
MKGLQLHTMPRIAKFAIDPNTSPAAKLNLVSNVVNRHLNTVYLKLAPTAAVSTHSFRIRLLCSRLGAAIMMRLVSQPFDTPNSARSTRKTKSELTRGACRCLFWSDDKLVEVL